MKKLFYLPILFTLLFSFGINAQKKDSTEKDKKPKKEKTYEDIITKDAVTDDGLFKVHKVKDKYYYEILYPFLEDCGNPNILTSLLYKLVTSIT